MGAPHETFLHLGADVIAGLHAAQRPELRLEIARIADRVGRDSIDQRSPPGSPVLRYDNKALAGDAALTAVDRPSGCADFSSPFNVGVRPTRPSVSIARASEKEAFTLEVLAIAMAVHNSGGIVIAQVERVAESGSLYPRKVKVPSIIC